MSDSGKPDDFEAWFEAEIDSAVRPNMAVEPSDAVVAPQIGPDTPERAGKQSSRLRHVRKILEMAFAKPSTPQPHQREPKRFGRFEVHDELGRGGFGIVFRSFDTRLKREVALKVPSRSVLSTPALRRRFLQEAEAVAMLDHPGIIPVFDSGEIDGFPYIASSYCPGPNLAKWLREQSAPPPFEWTAQVVQQLAEAVEHAHHRGVLHRDIKPSNILLAPTEASSPDLGLPFTPKLTDFGLAKVMESDRDQTRTGMMIGTPGYVSPELASGRIKEVGTWSDVFSLGMVLGEMLTRSVSREPDSLGDGARSGVGSGFRPRRVRPDVPLDLSTICEKATAIRHQDRYARAGEMAEDLALYLEGEPIKARPLGRTERFIRWTRSHPLVASLVAGLGLAIVALVVSAILFTSSLSVALRQAHEATEVANRNAEQARWLQYGSDMSLAFAAWDRGDTLAVRRLLQRVSPKGSETDLRSFEWGYLNWLAHRYESILEQRSNVVRSVAYSPNTRWIASGGGDGEVHIFAAGSGERIANLNVGMEANDLVFTANSKSLLVATSDGGIQFWDTKSWKLRTKRVEHADWVCRLTISPDGKLLASSDGSGQILIWDLSKGKVLQHLTRHEGEVRALAWSNDSKRLASSGNDFRMIVWQVKQGAIHQEYCLPAILLPGGEARSIAWDESNEHVLLSYSNREIVRIRLELEGQANQDHFQFFHEIGAIGLTSLGNNEFLVAHGIVIRRVRWRGTLEVVQEWKGHTERVTDLAISPDGQDFASTSYDGTTRRWPLSSTSTATEPLRPEGGVVLQGPLPIPKQNAAFFADRYYKTSLRTYPDLRLISDYPMRMEDVVSDGTVALIADTVNSECRLIRIGSPDTEGTIVARAPAGTSATITMAILGKRAIVVCGGLFELDLDNPTETVRRETSFHIHSIGRLPVGDRLAIIFEDGLDSAVGLWHPERNELDEIFRCKRERLIKIYISPDSRWAFLDRRQKGLTVIDLQNRQHIGEINHRMVDIICRFTADCRRILTLGTDGKLTVWRLPTLDQVGELDLGSFEPRGMAEFPDGAFLISTDNGPLHRIQCWMNRN